MNKILSLILLLTLGTGARAADPHAGHHSSTPSLRATAAAEVRSIDRDNHLLGVAHGAIPALKWPPMVMDFNASAEQLDGLAVGDRVELEIEVVEDEVHLRQVRRLPGG